MVGLKKQDFWPKINKLKGICRAPVSQKLDMILANKAVQKCLFYKKWSPKLVFLNNFFFEKIRLIFDIEGFQKQKFL